MTASVFVDTNVLLYAHDLDAGPKHETARRLVMELWSEQRGVLSTQVLQEFYVDVTRKLRLPRAEAREALVDFGTWKVERIGVPHILRASELEERFQLSFWDALIVAAAAAAGADEILSEDLSHGQRIDGVLIQNPFATRTS